jgi:hypothetical protein
MLVTLSPAIRVWRPKVDVELVVSTGGAALWSRSRENDCTSEVVVPTFPGSPGGFAGVETDGMLVTLSPAMRVWRPKLDVELVVSTGVAAVWSKLRENDCTSDVVVPTLPGTPGGFGREGGVVPTGMVVTLSPAISVWRVNVVSGAGAAEAGSGLPLIHEDCDGPSVGSEEALTPPGILGGLGGVRMGGEAEAEAGEVWLLPPLSDASCNVLEAGLASMLGVSVTTEGTDPDNVVP